MKAKDNRNRGIDAPWRGSRSNTTNFRKEQTEKRYSVESLSKRAMENKKITIEEIEERWNGSAKGYYESILGELSGGKHKAWQDLILEHAPQCKTLRVLDIGTGPGFFPVILGEKGHKVTGIDISNEMLSFARQNAEQNSVSAEFFQMDCTKTRFEDETFDLILCRNLTWTLIEPETAYREWMRILKTGGRLLIFDANWNRYLFDEDLEKKHEKNLQRVREKYGRASHDGLDQEKMKENGRRLPMGRYDRPSWDLKILLSLGFQTVYADSDISRWIPFSKQELMEYGDETPQFMIRGEK